MASTLPLSTKYRFPFFMNRTAYKLAMGAEAPPWNPGQREKHWVDLSAVGLSDDEEVMTYKTGNSSITGGVLEDSNGAPKVARMVMLPSQAAAINLPPEDNGRVLAVYFDDGTSRIPWPPPIFDLGPNEVLSKGLFNNEPLVRRTDVVAPPASGSGGLTAEEHGWLQGIAEKAGVI